MFGKGPIADAHFALWLRHACAGYTIGHLFDIVGQHVGKAYALIGQSDGKTGGFAGDIWSTAVSFGKVDWAQYPPIHTMILPQLSLI
jgi:hypothetical protein